MIVDVYSTYKDDLISLPYFHTTPRVQVAVSSIIIKFEKPYEGLVTLTSTLVDLNSNNPKQQICTFATSKSATVVYTPTRLVKYKANCCSSFDAFIKIELESERKIQKVYLQLEITDARLQ